MRAGCAAASATAVRRPAPTRLQGAGGMALQRLSQDGLSWVPTCCNMVALLCFGLCLALNIQVGGAAGVGGRHGAGWGAMCMGAPLLISASACHSPACVGHSCAPCLTSPHFYLCLPRLHVAVCSPPQVTDGVPVAILLLAPILLLLAQDPLLLRWLEDRRRYVPPCAAVTAYLAAAAAWQLAHDLGMHLGSMNAWAAWYLARHAALLVATLPCQLLLLVWLWRTSHQASTRHGSLSCRPGIPALPLQLLGVLASCILLPHHPSPLRSARPADLPAPLPLPVALPFAWCSRRWPCCWRRRRSTCWRCGWQTWMSCRSVRAWAWQPLRRSCWRRSRPRRAWGVPWSSQASSPAEGFPRHVDAFVHGSRRSISRGCLGARRLAVPAPVLGKRCRPLTAQPTPPFAHLCMIASACFAG